MTLDLSSPAGMDRARLAAAYIETDLIVSCEKRRALDPSSPAFDASLREDAKTLTSVLSARKTIITLDEHLQHRAAQLERYAAEVAQCEADQARLQAEAAAQEALHRQGLARAEELLTQLAAEDPAFARALAKAGADLASEFEHLRHPETLTPAQAQKRIDDQARQVAYNLLSNLRNDRPYAGIDPSRHAEAADRLARAQRGEPLPEPAPDPDDEDDDWDDDDDFDDDDTGSADVSSAFASDDEDDSDIAEDALSPGARASSPASAFASPSALPTEENAFAPHGSADALVRSHVPAANDACDDEDDWDTPEWDDEAVARRERAASLGPRTAPSATPPSHAHSAPLSPLKPFNPQTAINNWLRPATPIEQPTTTNEPSLIPQSSIPHSAFPIPHSNSVRTVPVCPTLSPRRLASIVSKNNLDSLAPIFPESAPASPFSHNAPDTNTAASAGSAAQFDSAPASDTPDAPDVPAYPVSIIYTARPERIPVYVSHSKGPPFGF